MDRRLIALLPLLTALSGLCSAGCQTGGNTALMERDLRLQEDRIYYLEDKLARLRDKLADCSDENKRLQCLAGELPLDSSANAADAAPLPPAEVNPKFRSPSGPDLSMPKIEIEAPAVPAAKPPAGNGASPSKIIRPGERRRLENDATVSRPAKVSGASPRPIVAPSKPKAAVAAVPSPPPREVAAKPQPADKWAPSTDPISRETATSPSLPEASVAAEEPGAQLKVSLPRARPRTAASNRWQPYR